jgi:rod shape-determining protein MreC
MVQSVDRATSFAITWAHPDFRVSAMSVDEGAFGIVQPHLGAGAERWLLEMRGVPFRAKLEPGTLLVSSGLGATYPRGIPIGTVLGELSTPEKWARTYLVKPSVLPEAIGPVLVLLATRTQRGVNGVWTTVNAADSAARAVAASGDSLARVAALSELAARRAALEHLELGHPDEAVDGDDHRLLHAVGYDAPDKAGAVVHFAAAAPNAPRPASEGSGGEQDGTQEGESAHAPTYARHS